MNGSEVPFINNYKMLGAAVVEQAARDYAEYVRIHDKRAESVERFFRGDLFKLYCDLDPEYIIERIRRTYKVKNKGGRPAKVNRGYR